MMKEEHGVGQEPSVCMHTTHKHLFLGRLHLHAHSSTCPQVGSINVHDAHPLSLVGLHHHAHIHLFPSWFHWCVHPPTCPQMGSISVHMHPPVPQDRQGLY